MSCETKDLPMFSLYIQCKKCMNALSSPTWNSTADTLKYSCLCGWSVTTKCADANVPPSEAVNHLGRTA